MFVMCVCTFDFMFSYQWENHHEAAFKINVLINKTRHKLSLACLYENIANLPSNIWSLEQDDPTHQGLQLYQMHWSISEHKKKTVQAKLRETSDLDIMKQIQFQVLAKQM
jgi:hypothetical protein